MNRFAIALIPLLLGSAALAQTPPTEPERPMTIGEVQMRTNLMNLDTSISQAMKQQAAVMKENEYLKGVLDKALKTCGEPCNPKPEDAKK